MWALDAALSAIWAMEEQALDNLLMIAARQNETTPEMLEAYRAKTLAGADRAQIRDKVAIINATGPLFKRANMMTALSGATSYDMLRRDLQAASDAGVKSLLLNIDSPGGEASGTNELAQAVYEMRDQMRIVAYVGGTGASAAYWLASAAHEIVVDPTARLGSIGVQLAFSEPGPKAGEKVFRFVSSQSPLKNAEADTEEGAKAIQTQIDAMAQVFVEAVARNRGVDTETVLSEFGKGGIFIGKDAVSAGLADRTGSFEGVLAELSASRRQSRSKGASMSDDVTFTAAERDAAVAAAKTAEKTRVANLRQVAAGFGASEADLTAAIDGDLSVEAFSLSQSAKAQARREAAEAEAKAKAEAEATAGKARIEALKGDEAAAAAAGSAAPPDEAQALDDLVSGVAAFLPADRRGK